MKQSTIIKILGIGLLFFLVVSQTPNQVSNTTIITKPAQPKQTYSMYGTPNEIVSIINAFSKSGYIVHDLEYCHSSNGTYYAMVVMYKY